MRKIHPHESRPCRKEDGAERKWQVNGFIEDTSGIIAWCDSNEDAARVLRDLNSFCCDEGYSHSLYIEGEEKEFEGFNVTQLASFSPNTNAFDNDAYNMGMQIATKEGESSTVAGKRVLLMRGRHFNRSFNYIIIVDEETGKRIKITIPK